MPLLWNVWTHRRWIPRYVIPKWYSNRWPSMWDFWQKFYAAALTDKINSWAGKIDKQVRVLLSKWRAPNLDPGTYVKDQVCWHMKNRSFFIKMASFCNTWRLLQFKFRFYPPGSSQSHRNLFLIMKVANILGLFLASSYKLTHSYFY